MGELRIVFMGTPELSCVSLAALAASEPYRIVGVVTQPDRPKGRELKLQPSPVKELAQRLSLTVLQPERARSEEFIEQMRGLAPELIAVAAYGQILPKSLLELPRFGCLNVHTSLLPKYRGAAPIQRAILNGDAQTGVTIMKMDVGLDTGDILAQEVTPILPEDTSETLHDRLAAMGAALLTQTIPEYLNGRLRPHPQPKEGISYAAKIQKHDGEIDWAQPALAIWNRVRGLVPWPGAFTLQADQAKPHLLKIWQAEVLDLAGAPGQILQADKAGLVVSCGTGALRILVLQREGGRRLSAQEFLAGYRLTVGRKLGPVTPTS